MIGKLITWGKTRDDAIQRMKRALIEFTMTGVKSNIVLHKSILNHPKFLSGEYTTQFCETDLTVETPDLFRYVDDEIFLLAAAIHAYKDREKVPVENKVDDISLWKKSGRARGMRI